MLAGDPRVSVAQGRRTRELCHALVANSSTKMKLIAITKQFSLSRYLQGLGEHDSFAFH